MTPWEVVGLVVLCALFIVKAVAAYVVGSGLIEIEARRRERRWR